MSYLLRMALRNTLRNRRRSALTLVAIFFGIAIFVLAQSLIAGFERTMIGTEIDSEHSHLRVMSRAFADEEDFFPVEQSLADVSALEADLRAQEPGALLARRSSFEAQLSNRKHSINLRGLAIDPKAYGALIRLGELPAPKGADHVIYLGSDVAGAFGAKVGDRLDLQAKTRHGTRNALTDVVVAAIVSTGHPLVDNFTVYLPQTSAQELLDLDAAYATELLVRFPDADDAFVAERLIEERRPALVAETWREKTEYIVRLNDVRRIVFNVFTFVIMLMAAAGVANTTLMSGYERIGEIGALLALGLSRRRVMGLFLIEAVLLALVGVGLGVVAGSGPAAYLERAGIHFPGTRELAGTAPMPPVLYLDLTPQTVVLAILLGFSVAVLAALYPAWKLSRTEPIYALKVEG